MAKMGGRKQLKRYSMPAVMRLPVKPHTWLTKPVPGPHPADKSIPLRVIIRDLLKLARTAKEADRIIFSGKVLVDGVVRREPKFPVGFMDVLEIPEIEKFYRISFDRLGRLKLVEIEREEKDRKLCRVIRKQTIRGGKVQITTHDGRNLIGDLKHVKIGDVVEVSLPDGKLLEHVPLSAGKLAMIMEGENAGRIGRIEEIREKTKTILLKADGEMVETPCDYVFVIGDEKPFLKVSDAQ